MTVIYEIALAIMTLAVITCAILTRKNKEGLGKSLRRLLVVTCITMGFNGLYAISPNVTVATVVFAGFSSCIDWLLIMFFDYTREYTDSRFSSRAVSFIAYVIAAIDTVSLIVNVKTHHVATIAPKFYESIKGNGYYAASSTWVYDAHLIFCYIISAAIFALLLIKMIRSASFYRRKYSVIMFFFVILLVLDGITILINAPYNLSMFAYCLISILITYFSLSYIPRSMIQDMENLVVQAMDASIICFDQNGRVIFANDHANEVIELSGRSDYIAKKYREWKAAYFDKPERESSWTEEGFIGGQLHFYETVAEKLYDDNHRYLGVYFIYYDRTEERNRHQREIDMEKEASERRSQFWATIAHEMRTPMNSILGMNELVLRETQDPEIMEYALNIKVATDSLIGLINDVLDFSKIDAGRMELHEEEYKVLHLLNNINVLTRSKMEEKGLEFKLEVDSYVPTALLGDELRIQQIIMNLMTNAIKYTDKGTITLRLYGERRFEDFYLHVEVEDTGIGMRKESIPLLFRAYDRVNEAKVHGIQGTGLGITICQNLLKLMDSQLDVHSEFGKGSNFHFAIKQPPMSMRYLENVDQFLKHKPAPEQIKEKDNRERLVLDSAQRILLVDDNEMNRTVFKALLKKSNLSITDVDSGRAALALTRKEKYDLIFLDHLMPEMDGEEVLHHIKDNAHDLNRSTPVVMMTANASDDAREKFLLAGFDDFLAKPVTPAVLEETIAKWLNRV